MKPEQLKKEIREMLEYKFRAWDKLNKKMYYDVQDGITIDGEHCAFGAILKDKSRWDVMQFTGLHDKNGREVYEGDVVTRTGSKWKKVVEWTDTRAGWNVFDPYPSYTHGKTILVLGNIYENPNP